MTGQVFPTPFDFEFMIWKVPVRVSGLFWLTAILLGWNWVESFDSDAPESPGRGVILGLWCSAVFLSILVHELGHVFAFRQFGIQASVVLYHFGGLAVPIGYSNEKIFSRRISALQDLWIALAGPLAQIGLAFSVAAAMLLFGYHVPGFETWTMEVERFADFQIVEATPLRAMTMFLIYPSIFWAFFNLLPVIPLDGGHIVQALDRHFLRTNQHALMLSMVVAGIISAWGFKTGSLYLGIFFASFAIANYQSLYGPQDSWR